MTPHTVVRPTAHQLFANLPRIEHTVPVIRAPFTSNELALRIRDARRSVPRILQSPFLFLAILLLIGFVIKEEFLAWLGRTDFDHVDRRMQQAIRVMGFSAICAFFLLLLAIAACGLRGGR